jgi:hypothetical protein
MMNQVKSKQILSLSPGWIKFLITVSLLFPAAYFVLRIFVTERLLVSPVGDTIIVFLPMLLVAMFAFDKINISHRGIIMERQPQIDSTEYDKVIAERQTLKEEFESKKQEADTLQKEIEKARNKMKKQEESAQSIEALRVRIIVEQDKIVRWYEQALARTFADYAEAECDRLNYRLVPNTKRMLAWLNIKGTVSESDFDLQAFLIGITAISTDNLINTKNVLLLAGLMEKINGLISITAKGKAFLRFIGFT